MAKILQMVELPVPTNIGEVGPWGIVTIAVLMVLTGLLLPRWTHTQRMADKDKQIANLTESLAKRDEQLDKLIESSELTVKLLEDFKKEARSQP